MKKAILFITGVVCAVLAVQAQQKTGGMVTGTVLSTDGQALSSASLILKNSGHRAITDASGHFRVALVRFPDTLMISRIGFQRRFIPIGKPLSEPLIIRLTPSDNQLQTVTVSTGYQEIPKARATGSFDFIDEKLLNRSVGPNILDRLKGVSSSLLFDPVIDNDLGISIRGRSTIFANTQPLIVVDNFPYEGDINDINPNDVKSITLLKDAAASSIWGARAGNGVIVITTKQGNYHKPLQVEVHGDVTVVDKPDLFYVPFMAPSDYIDVETFLFKKGYYNDAIHSTAQNALSPVVDLLNKVDNGTLSAREAQERIDVLRHRDVRHDFLKYLYRKAVRQQYAVSLSGGSRNQRYYFSAGYDDDLSSTVGDRYRRYTIRASTTYGLFHQKLEISSGVDWQQALNDYNGLSPAGISYGGGVLYPYARLADAKGNPLSIPQYNKDYIDTAGGGRLLDWHYRPLDELKYSDKSATATAIRLNLGVKYKIISGLSLDVKYRYGKQARDSRNLFSLKTYAARNYINTFSSINTSTGEVTYPVPMGALLDIGNTTATSQNLRGQLNYSGQWNGRHQVTAIAGAEIGDRTVSGKSYRYYGYDPRHETSIPVDLVNRYATYITGRSAQISSGQGSSFIEDRNISVYANAAYTYDNRLTLSASARKDASNLFGVRTNQKWVPLWSAGAGWNISRESFFHQRWLPYLKLRITYGYSGNVDKTVTALLTSRSAFNNRYQAPYSRLLNPPNADLRWERIGQTNFGVDFATAHNRIAGSIDYYLKKGTDLMGYAPLAPSSGLDQYKGNTSDMKGLGLDVNLTSRNIIGRFHWETQFLLSYAHDWVSRYKVKKTSIGAYVGGFMNPVVGKPVSALYSYRWAGLDPETGDPRAYLNGKISKDYSAIENSTNWSDMHYHGASVPTVFGGIRNTFSWQQLSFSFNLTYKLGYYFRRSSIYYGHLFNGVNLGHKDYALRWQQPGDEKTTVVPSMVYPANSSRDRVYSLSSVLVDKGGILRLQDIRLQYGLNARQIRKLPVTRLNVFVYVSNLGLLWRANKDGIDPDHNHFGYGGLPAPMSCSAGINLNF